MSDLATTATSIYTQALGVIEQVEPRIAAATRAELADQRASLKLIASENYASLPVLMTMGTWLSATSTPRGRSGTASTRAAQNVDTVESVAAEHARELFGAEYAYAQPHSGIDANLVAYWSILVPPGREPRRWQRLGAKTVNDLTEADWETLRGDLQRPSG